MGMLDRYTKSGGFAQLLALIESFDQAKREKFLGLIEQEIPAWAQALRERVLTFERILAWEPAILSEVIALSNLKHLSIAMHGMNEETLKKLLESLPHGERRKLENEYGLVKPTPGEISTTKAKMVEGVRQMIAKGELRIEKYDPTVVLDEKSEDRLIQLANASKSVANLHAVDKITAGIDLDELPKGGNHDSKGLSATIINLQKENKALKAEIRLLKDKLEQIRKIA